MTEPIKIPLDSRSHLESISSKMYESFSSDPLNIPVINWTLDSGDAYLKVSGVTATLVMTDNLTTISTSFNLVNDGNNNYPTVVDFKDWLTDKLTNYFITGFTIDWAEGLAPTMETRIDTFIRPDQTDWGVATDGHIWESLGESVFSVPVLDSIVSHQGLLICDSGTNVDLLLLGPDIIDEDREILAKWAVIVDTISDMSVYLHLGAELFIKSNDDNSAYIQLAIFLNGNMEIDFGDGLGGLDNYRGSWEGATVGDNVWVRWKVQGSTHSWKIWKDSEDEPIDWSGTYTTSISISARRVGVGSINAAPGSTLAYSYFNAHSLTTNSPLTALVIPEGYTSINYPIVRATGLNYLQMRVMALIFDLISSDIENFFTHLSVAGLDNYAPDPKSGLWLDWVGDFYGLNRLGREDVVETNEDYRRRILRMLSRPRENNVAVEDIVGQSIGIWDILVMDYRVFWALLIVFGRPSTPNLVLPLAKSVAPSGIRWTGIVIPGTSGNIGGAVAGRVRAGNSGISYNTSRSNSFRKREGWSPDITTDYWDDNVSLPLSGIFFVLR